MVKRVVTAELCNRYTRLVGVKSYKDIANELGVSKAVVCNIAKITGVRPSEEQKRALKRKSLSKLVNVELETKIVELWEDYSTQDIADQLGVTRSAISQHAARLGLKRTKEKRSILLSKAVTVLNSKIRRNMRFGIKVSNKNLTLNTTLAVQKQKTRTYLRQLGYSIEEASNDVVIVSNTDRKRTAEKNAKKLGFRFIEQSRDWWYSRIGTNYDLVQRYVNTVQSSFSLQDVLEFIQVDRCVGSKQVIGDYLRCMVIAGFLRKEGALYKRLKEVPFEKSAADLRRIRSDKVC